MDRRLSGADSSRTPMAWRHRDQLYQQQHGYHNGENIYGSHAPPPHSRSSWSGQPSMPRPPRTASPPETTSNSSSLSSESQAMPHHHHHHHHHGPPPGMQHHAAMAVSPATAAAMSTWDEAYTYGLPPGLPPPGMSPAMPPPGMLMLPPGLPPGYAVTPVMLAPAPIPPPGPPPAILLPPMMRPRPLVFPAVPATPTPPEPLPVREPKAALSLPPKEMIAHRSKVRCCRGGCVVLWIILGLILVGALLATALRFVVP